MEKTSAAVFEEIRRNAAGIDLAWRAITVVRDSHCTGIRPVCVSQVTFRMVRGGRCAVAHCSLSPVPYSLTPVPRSPVPC